jgi:hypothetical protein
MTNSTNFVDYNLTTPIMAGWLNDMDGHVYDDTPITPATTVHAAVKIANTPAGGLVAVTVQAALNELDTEASVESARALAAEALLAPLINAVLVNPALGTPASGVLTNCTGTAAALSIGGNAATATITTGNAGTASKLANIAGGLKAVTAINDTATPTTGGVTLANQVAADLAVWRIRAMGTFVAVSSATGRNAVIQPFWGATALPSVAVAVKASVAQTTNWEAEFVLTGSSTTGIWTVGYLNNKIQYPAISAGTSGYMETGIVTAATTAVTAGAQTLDLRFSMSVAVATDIWNVHSVVIEKIL